MRTQPLFLGLLAGLCVASPVRASEDTLLWAEVRGGMGFFNDIDPDPIERVATQLSTGRRPAGSDTRRVEFIDKIWEIPFDIRVGIRAGDNINFWGFYERLPYLLENDVYRDNPDPTFPRYNDSITLNIPGNVFGAGFDFRLGSEGYGNSILLGIGAGTISVRGDDEDIFGFQNYEISGSSLFWEVQAMAEFEFTTEMSFLPFIAFRSATVTNPDVRVFPRGEQGIDNDPDYDAFEIDYTGVTVGLSIRFRVYPFDIVGDPDDGFDD